MKHPSRTRPRATILFYVSLLVAAGGCSRSCSKSSTVDVQDAAVLDPIAALLADDGTDQQIAEEIAGKNLTTWVIELRYLGGESGPAVRIAINGNGRVSRWNDPNAQGAPDDTLVLPRAKVLRLFVKFEKAQFTSLASSGGAGAPPTTLAYTKDNRIAAVTRSGPADPAFDALVKLVLQAGDLGKQPHTDDDCQWVDQCKKSGQCRAEGSRCVAKLDADCRASMGCKERGACALADAACVVASDADCKASTACASAGLCALRDGKCVATAAGCKASSTCAESGACKERDGVCVAARDDDCKRSTACKTAGLCVAKCDRCMKSADEPCGPAAATSEAQPASSASAGR